MSTITVPASAAAAHFAGEVTCPKCKMMFDDTGNNTTTAQQDLRFPIKLVPCSHTVCRPCIRMHYAQTSQQSGDRQPICPICSRAIEVTSFDEAVLLLVRSAHTQMCANARQYAPDGSSGSSSSSNMAPPHALTAAANFDSIDTVTLSASLGPLAPAIRQQIQERCVRPEDAPRAEQIARACGSLHRAIELSKQEFDAAKQERDAAHDATSAKGTVVTTLQGELSALDDRLRQLQLDRQVVLTQLQAAIGAQSGAVRYRTECEMRILELQRRIQAEAAELENRIKVMNQLAPGVQFG